MRIWKIEESCTGSDCWYIYSKHSAWWWPFWCFHDVRFGMERAAARMLELRRGYKDLFETS